MGVCVITCCFSDDMAAAVCCFCCWAFGTFGLTFCRFGSVTLCVVDTGTVVDATGDVSVFCWNVKFGMRIRIGWSFNSDGSLSRLCFLCFRPNVILNDWHTMYNWLTLFVSCLFAQGFLFRKHKKSYFPGTRNENISFLWGVPFR